MLPMMTAVRWQHGPTFDTLKMVRTLEKKGFSAQQSEAIVEALVDVSDGRCALSSNLFRNQQPRVLGFATLGLPIPPFGIASGCSCRPIE